MSRQERGISTRDLVRTAVDVVDDARESIHAALKELAERPDNASSHFTRVLRDSKEALGLDLSAEDRCKHIFHSKFGSDVQFVGEETLAKFSSWGGARYCVLVDMVDGTDLVEMNLGLWCSAIVIYDQKFKRIVGSVVGLPTGETYYAEYDRNGAWVRIGGHEYEVDGASDVVNIDAARIAFYGQKAGNFLSIATRAGLISKLSTLSGTNAGFRIYNFAGNPMMVKMCNRPKAISGETITNDIDVVFDVLGQQLHDVVPGAFIAMKGGATLIDLDGSDISYDKLGGMLYNPKSTLQYIISATPQLGQEISQIINAL